MRRENNSYSELPVFFSPGHMFSYCQNREEAIEGEIVANESFRLPRSSKSPAACPKCERSLGVPPPQITASVPSSARVWLVTSECHPALAPQASGTPCPLERPCLGWLCRRPWRREAGGSRLALPAQALEEAGQAEPVSRYAMPSRPPAAALAPGQAGTSRDAPGWVSCHLCPSFWDQVLDRHLNDNITFLTTRHSQDSP